MNSGTPVEGEEDVEEGIKEEEEEKQQGGATASTLLLWLCVHPLSCRWSHQHRWAVTSSHHRQRPHGSTGGGGKGEEQRMKGGGRGRGMQDHSIVH